MPDINGYMQLSGHNMVFLHFSTFYLISDVQYLMIFSVVNLNFNSLTYDVDFLYIFR